MHGNEKLNLASRGVLNDNNHHEATEWKDKKHPRDGPCQDLSAQWSCNGNRLVLTLTKCGVQMLQQHQWEHQWHSRSPRHVCLKSKSQPLKLTSSPNLTTWWCMTPIDWLYMTLYTFAMLTMFPSLSNVTIRVFCTSVSRSFNVIRWDTARKALISVAPPSGHVLTQWNSSITSLRHQACRCLWGEGQVKEMCRQMFLEGSNWNGWLERQCQVVPERAATHLACTLSVLVPE